MIFWAATEPTPTRGRRNSDAHAPGVRDGQDMRERLQKADALQAAGKLDEAVAELLAVAALYATRNVPVKALAVLRIAVRLRPENPDVRISYGEVLAQQRMLEDAAREYMTACQLYESGGQYGEWLDVMRLLLAIDVDYLAGHLQLAEALSRAARYDEAARVLRDLAARLLKRGAIADWEKVAERLVHHEAGDVSTAHELALHYVRSGRHGEALAKLIVCYESVPGDAEMLELIIETLESLGQREKAAIICRELIRTFRRTGLEDEANRALQRLHTLAPDDVEARDYVGALFPTIAADTVIELEAGTTMPERRASSTVVMPSILPKHVQENSQPPRAATPAKPAVAEPFAYPTVSPPAVPSSVRVSVDANGRTAVAPVASVALVAAPVSAKVATPADRTEAMLKPPTGLPGSSRPSQAPSAPASPALQALTASLAHLPPRLDDDDDEEAGFGIEDRTMIEGAHILPAPAFLRPAAPNMVPIGLGPPPMQVPIQRAPPSTEPRQTDPFDSTSHRSNALPRPRLARRLGTMTELPTTVRDMSKDLGTLDFFIERGFYESAVALFEALIKRHPGHPELQGYRTRIDRMLRS